VSQAWFLFDELPVRSDQSGDRPVPASFSIDGHKPDQFSVFICPLIPDANTVVFQVLDICITVQKPKQLINYGSQMQLFGVIRGKPSARSKRNCLPKTDNVPVPCDRFFERRTGGHHSSG